MESKKTEIVVGSVVLIGLVFLVLGLIWGVGTNILETRQALLVRFPDVRGLKAGDPLSVRGVRKGEVESITLTEDAVEVSLLVAADVPLYSDLSVVISDRELMGGKQVELNPGQNGIPADLHTVYSGRPGTDLTSLLQRGGHILTQVDSLLSTLEQGLSPFKSDGLLNRSVSILEQADSLFKENRAPLRRFIKGLEEFSHVLGRDSAAVHTARLIAKLEDLAVGMDSSIILSTKLLQRLENEEGTAGKLIRDQEAYRGILRTIARLDSLLTDIEEHPKKYLKFSIF